MSRILDSHSRIAVHHDTYFYPIFHRNLYRYGDLRQSQNLGRFISDLLESIRVLGSHTPRIDEFQEALVAPTFEGVLATFLHLHARGEGKVRGGDKTPGHHMHLREISAKFPDSPVIFVIRDPRDTVLSIRKAFGTSIAGATRSWNAAFLSYSQAPRPVHLVRYEELVQQPAQEVRAMCAFLGEPYESTMLRFFERIPEFLRTRNHLRKLLEPVSATSVGSFREMSASDIERIEAACAVGMEALGYPFTTQPRMTKSTVPLRLNPLMFLLDQLRYYRLDSLRWRRGWFRWKMSLRVYSRYLLTLGPFRSKQ